MVAISFAFNYILLMALIYVFIKGYSQISAHKVMLIASMSLLVSVFVGVLFRQPAFVVSLIESILVVYLLMKLFYLPFTRALLCMLSYCALRWVLHALLGLIISSAI